MKKVTVILVMVCIPAITQADGTHDRPQGIERASTEADATIARAATPSYEQFIHFFSKSFMPFLQEAGPQAIYAAARARDQVANHVACYDLTLPVAVTVEADRFQALTRQLVQPPFSLTPMGANDTKDLTSTEAWWKLRLKVVSQSMNESSIAKRLANDEPLRRQWWEFMMRLMVVGTSNRLLSSALNHLNKINEDPVLREKKCEVRNVLAIERMTRELRPSHIDSVFSNAQVQRSFPKLARENEARWKSFFNGSTPESRRAFIQARIDSQGNEARLSFLASENFLKIARDRAKRENTADIAWHELEKRLNGEPDWIASPDSKLYRQLKPRTVFDLAKFAVNQHKDLVAKGFSEKDSRIYASLENRIKELESTNQSKDHVELLGKHPELRLLGVRRMVDDSLEMEKFGILTLAAITANGFDMIRKKPADLRTQLNELSGNEIFPPLLAERFLLSSVRNDDELVAESSEATHGGTRLDLPTIRKNLDSGKQGLLQFLAMDKKGKEYRTRFLSQAIDEFEHKKLSRLSDYFDMSFFGGDGLEPKKLPLSSSSQDEAGE